jgi:hypothetical protein
MILSDAKQKFVSFILFCFHFASDIIPYAFSRPWSLVNGFRDFPSSIFQQTLSYMTPSNFYPD